MWKARFTRMAALVAGTALALTASLARAQASAGALQAAALANYKPVPIPKDPKVKTHLQFIGEMKAWEHGLLKAGIDKIPAAAPWKRDADRLFAIYVQLDAPGTWEATPEIKALRELLIKANCDDAYVQFCLGAIGEWTDDKAEQARGYQFMLDHPTPGVGGDYLLMKASYHVFDGAKDAKSRSAALAANIEALKRLLAADLKEPETDRYLFRFIVDGMIDEQNKTYSDQFRAVVDAAAARKTWMALILEGIVEFNRAFDSRGTDAAANVTDAGWAGLQLHAGKARELITAAWQKDRGRPEAAGEMCKIAIMDSALPAMELRLWFDRAVADEMDFPLAYGAMEWGLMPRWLGGSGHDALLAFGKEAMATGRYDSGAPLFYLKALVVVSEDMPKDLWRVPFRYDDGPARLKEMIDGYEKTTPSVLKSKDFASLRAMAADWSGRYDDALIQLQKLPPGEEFEYALKQAPHTPTAYLERSRAAVEAEARAFTGPQRETLRQAETLELQGKIPEAVEIFKKAYAATAGDKPVHDYLRDRIALALLAPIAGNYSFGAEGRTSDIFQTAIETESTASIDFLLDAGFDLSQTNSLGSTPIYSATTSDKREIAQRLLEKGANPNVWTTNRWTPLTAAVVDDHIDMIDLLIAHGADVNFPYQGSTSTPLDLAIMKDKPEAVARLRAAGAKSGDPGALFQAVGDKNADLTAYLLDHGAKPEAPRSGGDTVLHAAALADDVAMIDLLLKHGADVNVPNAESKITPLDAAAMWNRTKAMARLEAAGGKRTASAAVASARPAAPFSVKLEFYEAVLADNMPKVRELIAKGLDPNFKLSGRSTPLHGAVFNGNPLMVKALIDAGAKAKPLTEGGWTEATQLGFNSLRGQHPSAMSIFMEDAVKMPDLDHTPATARPLNSRQLQAMLDKDPDWKSWSAGLNTGAVFLNVAHSESLPVGAIVPIAVSPSGASVVAGAPLPFTVLPTGSSAGGAPPKPMAPPGPQSELFAAVAADNLTKAKELIAKGGDVNGKAPGGATPLHAAVYRGDLEMIKLLMQSGAKAKPLTEGGWLETRKNVSSVFGDGSVGATFFQAPKGTADDPDKTPCSIGLQSVPQILPLLNKDPDWNAYSEARKAAFRKAYQQQ